MKNNRTSIALAVVFCGLTSAFANDELIEKNNFSASQVHQICKENNFDKISRISLNSNFNTKLKENMLSEYHNRLMEIDKVRETAKGIVEIQKVSYDFPKNPLGFNRQEAINSFNASQDRGNALCQTAELVIQLFLDAQSKQCTDISHEQTEKLVQFLEKKDDDKLKSLAVNYLRLKKAVAIKTSMNRGLRVNDGKVNILPLIKAKFIKVSQKKSVEDEAYIEGILENVRQDSSQLVRVLMNDVMKINNDLYVHLFQ